MVMQVTTNADIIRYPSDFCAEDKLDSSVSQPKMTFGSDDLYPTLLDKAGILTFSLVTNHCFYDGNKRTAHLALELFLGLNGWELTGSKDEQKEILVQIAENTITRPEFLMWLENHVKPFDPNNLPL